MPVRPRKAPVWSAWQVTSENLDRVAAWCGGRVIGRDIERAEVAVPRPPDDYGLAEDWAEPGQYVIRAVDGGSFEFFVMEAWMFERDYEEASS